ncbi:MAG: hypothetical protein AB9866_10050 [Syntrophobacteraceae bacterium]
MVSALTQGKPPLIWIIDNIHWERANIRACLMEEGFEVDGFESIFHALVGLYREIVEKPALIVLEIQNLGYRTSDLEELLRLDVPILLLTGVFEEKKLLEKWKWPAVMRRPFTIGQVAETIERLLKPLRFGEKRKIVLRQTTGRLG